MGVCYVGPPRKRPAPLQVPPEAENERAKKLSEDMEAYAKPGLLLRNLL